MTKTKIKERPILFSGEMVRAILEGHKTQTRRAVKQKVVDWLPTLSSIDQAGMRKNSLCPYGYPGDHLYVRETFYAYGRWETRFGAKKGRDEWHFVDMTTERGLQYKYSDSPPELINKKKDAQIVRWWKRPSLFMPRAASRILLEITDVRVERLHEISEADAKAEGVSSFRPVPGDGPAETLYQDYMIQEKIKAALFGVGFRKYSITTARESFFTLWQSINGTESLESNPWVWVVSFKQVEQ